MKQDNTYPLIFRINFKGKTRDISGNIEGKSTYKYDDKGNKIEENWYNPDCSFNDKSTYKYDDKGNEIEWNSYNADGSLDNKYTYQYDDMGNQIEWNRYKADGILYSKGTYEYEFDNIVNWIKKAEFNNDMPYEITERELTYF